MHVCFTSDLHGRDTLYRQLDALIRRERPDLLLLGGDLFPDGNLQDPANAQRAWLRDVFLPRVRSWKQTVARMTVACIMGNHDWTCSADDLEAADEVVLLGHASVTEVNGCALLGYSFTPPTPFWVKDFERLDRPGDEVPETGGLVWDASEVAVRQVDPREHFLGTATLECQLAEVPPVDEPFLFVCHAPPHDTRLDRLPHIDWPVGSRAIRAFIETRQPALALHGHIHESPEVTGAYLDRVGDSLCVNPGQTNERLYAVCFDTERTHDSLRHNVLTA